MKGVFEKNKINALIEAAELSRAGWQKKLDEYNAKKSAFYEMVNALPWYKRFFTIDEYDTYEWTLYQYEDRINRITKLINRFQQCRFESKEVILDGDELMLIKLVKENENV